MSTNLQAFGGAIRRAQPRPSFLAGVGVRLLAWDARYRQRRRLETLSDAMLADIGRSRDEAAAEAGKPFWRD